MMNLVDQMAVIQAECSSACTTVCCWGAAILVAVLGLIYLGKIAAGYVDRLGRGGRFAQIAGIVATIAVILYGGTKSGSHLWQFSYSNGLTDNGSYATNDTAVSIWNVSNPILLDVYMIRAQYRNLTVTNAVGECVDTWHGLEGISASSLTKSWTVPDATNCAFVVWAEYVAPIVVHTNGVYHLGGLSREMGGSQKYVPVVIPVDALKEDGSRERLTPTNAPPTFNGLQMLYNEMEEQE